MHAPPSIRAEQPGDHTAIAAVHLRAFGRPHEARLVAELRAIAHPAISLVALRGSHLVGHILFTPVTIHGSMPSDPALGLGPLAVLPEHQRSGVGSALVRAGLAACTAAAHPVVFVFGAPGFYSRFGFRPAGQHGLWYQSAVSEPAFQVAELVPGSLGTRTGRVAYLPPFYRV